MYLIYNIFEKVGSMFKNFVVILFLCLTICPCLALDEESEAQLLKEQSIQTRIDNVGVNLLNYNKIPRRIVFLYNKNEKKKFLTTDKTLTKRQVILYDGLYQYIETDDELAAMLAREISTAVKSYTGIWGGTLDTLQVALGSKKFETVADKRAVDYMVNANYNPLALIVFIQKTCPQKRFDKFSRHNLTSKRLARIYEYITYKYPEYLKDNDYINNKYYQNFLLDSVVNRRMLQVKIENNSNEELDYE